MFSSAAAAAAEALLLLLNNPLYSDCGFAEIFKYDIWIPCFYSHPTGIGLKQPPLFSVTTYCQVRALLFSQSWLQSSFSVKLSGLQQNTTAALMSVFWFQRVCIVNEQPLVLFDGVRCGLR